MRPMRRARTVAWIAMLALVCVGAAFVQESFVHTDDGCGVEIHCLACRLAAGTAAVVSPALHLPAAVEAASLLLAARETGPREAARRPSSSRAPPLA
jgi:hypothetical protein